MNKIEKFLKKLNPIERKAVLLIMKQLLIDYKKLPNIKKLSGFEDLFRIRVGNYRIIFIASNNQVEIVRISKRNENSYKNI